MTPKRLAALVVYGAASLLAVGLGALGLARGWAFERELFWLRASGWSALGAMLIRTATKT